MTQFTCMESRFYADRAINSERIGDQSWYRAVADEIIDHVTELNWRLAQEWYDKAGAARREADRQEIRYGRKIAA